MTVMLWDDTFLFLRLLYLAVREGQKCVFSGRFISELLPHSAPMLGTTVDTSLCSLRRLGTFTRILREGCTGSESFPRSSPTSAAAGSWLGFAGDGTICAVFPWVFWLRTLGSTVVVDQKDSYDTYVYGWFCWFRDVSPFVVDRPEVLGILVGIHQKDSNTATSWFLANFTPFF